MHRVKLHCLKCGEEKINLEETLVKSCDICGQEFEADTTCENKHYICHDCRQKAARQDIISHCLKSRHDSPYPLLLELMKLPATAIHGPEHHLLITAAFLTAYSNEKSSDGLKDMLEEANRRTLQVPGGICGYWGICGAAIGAGIYVSIITESSPFAESQWKKSGQVTAKCGDAISAHEGPRCCKRDGFLAMLEAIDYSNRVLNTHFKKPDKIECEFFINNKECKGVKCPFFPVKK